MELEYADYRNPSKVTTSSSLSAMENLCSDSELLEKIKYTATLMEQLAEHIKGKYLVTVSEYHNLTISVLSRGTLFWALASFFYEHPKVFQKILITSDLNEQGIPIVNIQISYALKGNPIY